MAQLEDDFVEPTFRNNNDRLPDTQTITSDKPRTIFDTNSSERGREWSQDPDKMMTSRSYNSQCDTQTMNSNELLDHRHMIDTEHASVRRLINCIKPLLVSAK